mgnify:CR=1 FL=1
MNSSINGSSIARSVITNSQFSSAIVTDATISNNVISAGTITVAITAAQSSAISAGSYAYDLELVSGSSAVTRLLQGSFTVVGNVTR